MINFPQQTEMAVSGRVTRRQFMAGLGAFTLAVSFKGQLALAAEVDANTSFSPNAYIHIDLNGKVQIISSYLEMGQGVFTGLATLAAEELALNATQLEVVAAPADVSQYANPVLVAIGFNVQGTGGSTAMRGAWSVMRLAAATARTMLLQAAAKQWRVPISELEAIDGTIHHKASAKQAGYGAFVSTAATLPRPAPASVQLKTTPQFTQIGQQAMPRVDVPEKVNGKAIYTQDIKLPGMLVAVIAHPPRLFAKITHINAAKAKAIAGVVAVLEIPGDDQLQGGVAVLAKNTWVAKKGRDALELTWDESSGVHYDSDELFTQFKAQSATPGTTVLNRGSQPTEVPTGGHVIDALFEMPYLAHATMEPMNALIHLEDDHCQLWNGEQWHTADQAAIAKEVGLSPAQVGITQLYAGGSFGRRANPSSDYVVEAARIAKIARNHDIKVPIKLVWLREEDMRGLAYRPMTVHNARLVLDKAGNITGWRWRIVGQSFFNTPTNQVDSTLVEGSHDMPYAIANLQVEQHIPNVHLPVAWMRSVGHTHTAVVGETLIDEAATIAGKDPYQYRRQLLKAQPKFLAVLDLVAEKAGWQQPIAQAQPGEKRARGIAIRESFGTIVAQVAEVTLSSNGAYRVDKVFSAVDCGQVINPDVITSQVEGGIGFALSFLRQEITLKAGQVQQGNFNHYPVLRMDAMPEVAVYCVPSSNDPTGIGEPGVPPLVPAVLNALAVITGRYERRLPLPAKISL